MGRRLALGLVPALLACGALALTFEAIRAELSVVAVVLLGGSAIAFAGAAMLAIGTLIQARFEEEAQKQHTSITTKDDEKRPRYAIALFVTAAVMVVVAFALEWRALSTILSLMLMA